MDNFDNSKQEQLTAGEDEVEQRMKQLQDEDWGVRLSAISRLGYLNDLRAVSPLLQIAKTKPNPSSSCPQTLPFSSLRYAAFFSLGQLGFSSAVGPLIELLDDQNDDQCSFIIYVLGQIADAQAVEPLIKALQDEKLGYAAAATLGKFGDQRAISPLLKLLNADNHSLKFVAAKSLAELGDRRSIPQLLATLEEMDQDNRRDAVTALGLFKDKELLKPLIKVLLSDKNSGVRYNAAISLSELEDRDTIEPFIQALEDDVYVRAVAARALGTLKAYQAIAALYAALENDYSHDPLFAKLRIVGTLYLLGEKKAFDLLLDTLRNQDSETRARAIRALSAVKDKQAVEPLIGMLQDPEVEVRKEAIKALEDIGDLEALPALRQLVEITSNPNDPIKEAAQKAIENIASNKNS